MSKTRRSIALAAALLATACGTNSAIQRSDAFLEDGYLQQAYQVVDEERARQLQDGGSVDSELEAAYRDLRFDWLVQQGRLEIYSNREAEGRKLLEEALAMRPDDEAARQLVVRSHNKQAARATAAGQLHLGKGEMDLALAKFDEALQHVAGYKDAIAGIELVRQRVSTLHGQAQKQYLEAIRKLQEFRYPEVDWHAKAALKREPERADAEDVRRKAQLEMAVRARDRGEQNRRDGIYGAALMQFRTASDLAPELAGIGELIASTTRELEAVTLTEKATLALRGDRLADARTLLAQAFEKSTLERGAINELQHAVRKREGELAYRAAHDLEIQGDKQGALEAYQKLSADWPDGLLDERTRIGALSIDIENCGKAYAAGIEAEQAGQLEKALEEFQSAAIYYGRYKDLDACIERLKAAIAARGAGSNRG